MEEVKDRLFFKDLIDKHTEMENERIAINEERKRLQQQVNELDNKLRAHSGDMDKLSNNFRDHIRAIFPYSLSNYSGYCAIHQFTNYAQNTIFFEEDYKNPFNVSIEIFNDEVLWQDFVARATMVKNEFLTRSHSNEIQKRRQKIDNLRQRIKEAQYSIEYNQKELAKLNEQDIS